jgi:hypothetical protein
MRPCLNATNRKILAITLILLLSAGVVACSAGNQGGSALPVNKGGNAMANKVLTQNISEPLNGANSAKIDVNCGTGHLTIDKLNADDQALAKGTLQYLQNQGLPNKSLNMSDGQATFTLKAGDIKSSGFRFPWAACGGAYEWQIKLNPAVPSDIAVQSRGGNVKLNLNGMCITRLSADTGGGNLDVVLPDNSANLIATAKTGGGNVNLEVGNGTAGNNTITANSGAGNVVVRLPNGVAAKVYATTGVGRVTIDPRFVKIDKNTYQSADYENAATRFDITAHSGAGNVSVITK